MSRIGRMPIAVPANVTVTVAEGNVVTVKASVLFFVGRTLNGNDVTLLLEGHSGAEGLGQSSKGTCDRYDVSCSNGNRYACGNFNGHSSNS